MNREIRIGLGTCGISAGGEAVRTELIEQLKVNNLDIPVNITGCIGMCYVEVLVEIIEDNKKYMYGKVTPEMAKEIVSSHLVNGKPVTEWIIKSAESFKEASFFSKQKRIVLRNCGIINPLSIEEYEASGGYTAIKKVLKEMTPDDVIKTVTDSGIRGRGGAGFATGVKWKFAKQSPGDKKYLICNADEGDPGAFMDRSVLEGDPHAVLEGMMIAAIAIGADEAYIYVRAEYPLAIKHLKNAIKQCEEKNYIGKNIFGTDKNFKVNIKEGAGAFVCGEETALIASIEGKRGIPRVRPPFPAVKGLWGKPTNINNVETFANIPWIINNGAEQYAAFGSDKNRGTKVFALAGKIAKSGLAEVPLGLTINEIIFDIGGGIKGGKKFKAVQMGGPSGGCIPADMGDTRIEYEEILKKGAIMGSGGMIVLDETTCMVDLAKYFLSFTQNESCGKCTFCRVGTKRMLEILTRITEGKGREGDVELLLDLGSKIRESSLCGLGQGAPNPVLTTIRYFRDEYDAHIREKKCPAHNCKALLTYTIIPDKCTGCTACARKCPVDAISGEKKKVHLIDQDKCIKCGACFNTCRFDAIEKL